MCNSSWRCRIVNITVLSYVKQHTHTHKLNLKQIIAWLAIQIVLLLRIQGQCQFVSIKNKFKRLGVTETPRF